MGVLEIVISAVGVVIAVVMPYRIYLEKRNEKINEGLKQSIDALNINVNGLKLIIERINTQMDERQDKYQEDKKVTVKRLDCHARRLDEHDKDIRELKTINKKYGTHSL